MAERFDIENFPDNETAKELLHMVSEEFYENSYVGKWLFEVMGIEWGEVKERLSELPDQFFIDSATWGFKWHEIKYGLPIRDYLDEEERRKLIYKQMDSGFPMTPYHMEERIREQTGIEAHVMDWHDNGGYGEDIAHPNSFIVYIYGRGDTDTEAVKGVIDSLKQSHTDYEVFLVRVSEIILRAPVAFCDDEVFEIRNV